MPLLRHPSEVSDKLLASTSLACTLSAQLPPARYVPIYEKEK